MELRRITFQDIELSVDCWPAIPEFNCIFDAARQAILAPHTLAITIHKIGPETAVRLLAECYAEGVIKGSPTETLGEYALEQHARFCDFTRDQWALWLQNHSEEFDDLQAVASNPKQFGLRAA